MSHPDVGHALIGEVGHFRPWTRVQLPTVYTVSSSALALDTLSSAIERICARVRARNVARRYALTSPPSASRSRFDSIRR
jgi:hypothetical protein